MRPLRRMLGLVLGLVAGAAAAGRRRRAARAATRIELKGRLDAAGEQRPADQAQTARCSRCHTRRSTARRRRPRPQGGPARRGPRRRLRPQTPAEAAAATQGRPQGPGPADGRGRRARLDGGPGDGPRPAEEQGRDGRAAPRRRRRGRVHAVQGRRQPHRPRRAAQPRTRTGASNSRLTVTAIDEKGEPIGSGEASALERQRSRRARRSPSRPPIPVGRQDRRHRCGFAPWVAAPPPRSAGRGGGCGRRRQERRRWRCRRAGRRAGLAPAAGPAPTPYGQGTLYAAPAAERLVDGAGRRQDRLHPGRGETRKTSRSRPSRAEAQSAEGSLSPSAFCLLHSAFLPSSPSYPSRRCRPSWSSRTRTRCARCSRRCCARRVERRGPRATAGGRRAAALGRSPSTSC